MAKTEYPVLASDWPDMPDSAVEDDELLGRIAGGDRDAFAALYRRRRPDVYRFALHMCGSPSQAEDVVQDVFVAVIGSASAYQPGRSGALPWLLGIARNHVRRLRPRREVLPLPAEDSADGQKLAFEADPVGALTCQRRSAALARVLLDVPARYREVIVLCDLQELSYDTAAGILQCAIGTVRSRLHRGRAHLARRLCGKRQAPACPVPVPKPS